MAKGKPETRHKVLLQQLHILRLITTPATIKYIKVMYARVLLHHGVALEVFRTGRHPKPPQQNTGIAAFNEMYLAYIIAIFDSFLSDLTKFLFCTRPERLSDDRLVPVTEITSRARAVQTLNRVIDKKCRDLAYKSFAERIAVLRKTFELSISLNEKQSAFLRTASLMRNQIVHSQDVFAMHVDQFFRLQKRKLAELKVTDAVCDKAVVTTSEIMVALYTAVADRYRGLDPKDDLDVSLEPLRRLIKIYSKESPASSAEIARTTE